MLGQAERLYELRSLFTGKPVPGSSVPVFSFVSGKGGTGKTFLSLNLANALSKLNKKVLYIDLDFNLANGHIMLDINPSKTISDFFTHRALFEDIIFGYSSSLHIIAGDSGKIEMPEINEEDIARLLSEINLLSGYSAVFIDLPAGAGKNIIKALSLSSYCIIVANTEPTAVMDAYVISKLVKYEGLKCDMYVVVNKSKSDEDGENAFNNLNAAASHFLKENLKLLSFIPYSEDAFNSICAQKLLTDSSKSSHLAVQIKSAACKISEILHVANIHQQPANSI